MTANAVFLMLSWLIAYPLILIFIPLAKKILMMIVHVPKDPLDG
ncbi:hypothetical protein AAC899_02140 [Acinetobacter soli]|nr:hypothetical protein [Acinetobacter soli]